MAEEGDAERLVVYLEARIRDFEKNMAKASGTATRDYGAMRKQSTSATRQMEQDMVRSTSRINQALATTGGLGKSMIAGFAGGLVAGGIAGLVSQVGQVASAVASVGDEARRAGVDVEAFQELKYVAEQNRIGVDSLTDGLKELNLRADEFIVTKGGAAAEAFQRLGYDAETLKEKLADPSALFTEIIGKLGQLDKAAQIRVADEIFGGTGGEKFVQLIGQGEQGIRDTIQQARDLGLVMSQDLIDKAVDLDQKFNAVSTTVGTALKTAIVEAANALGIFLDQFRSIEERTYIRPLQNQLATLYNEREFLEEEQAKLAAGMQIPLISDHAMNSTRDRLAAVTAEIEVLAGRIGELQGEGTTPPPIKPTTIPTVTGSGAPAKRDKEAEDLERQERAVKNLIAGLEFEKSIVGLSALEQQKLTVLRQAGAAATEDQRLQIGRLIDETAREQATVDHLTGLYDMLGDAGQSAVMGIMDAMADGKIEAEEFGSILSSVLGMAADFFLNAAFKGISGGGAGGFNIMSLFPHRETGGPVAAGTPYIVGEKRPELFVPSQSGTIVPRVPTGASQGHADNRVFSPTFNINGSGLNQEQVQAVIDRSLDHFNRFTIPARVGEISADPLARG